MPQPDWYYDDMRQVGLDFADEAQVASYDARQGGDAAAERRLLEELGLAPYEMLADIGCGTGVLACEAARVSAHIHAIDISPAMLAAARRRAEHLGLGNIAFQQAGFLGFAIAPQSLDWITSQFALHHLPDFWKSEALVRMRAALRPSGRLLLRDVVFSCSADRMAETVEAWANWMTAQTGYSRAEVATHVRDEHSTFGWIMEGLIERAGFRLLSVDYEMGVYARYLAQAR
jgi:ubiquinone/menaquinone biosynthesis C-methylase UbiE